MPNDKKEEKKSVTGSVNLAKTLNDITFNNKQVRMITEMQEEKAKLKEQLGRRKSRVAETPRIQGLQTIKNTLGRQFLKSQSDY